VFARAALAKTKPARWLAIAAAAATVIAGLWRGAPEAAPTVIMVVLFAVFSVRGVGRRVDRAR
jgi:asparagine N-glycosylation enzyme membrane subunit Stt3